MIDAVDLLFLEPLVHFHFQLDRAVEVPADGFLEHDAGPTLALLESDAAHSIERGGESTGRKGEVEEAISRQLVFGLDRLDAFAQHLVGVLDRITDALVVQAGLAPREQAHVVDAGFLQRLARELAKALVVHVFVAGHRENRPSASQATGFRQTKDRRQ